jgi:hypothetical protein
MTWQDPYRQSGWQEQPYDPYGQNAAPQTGQSPYGQNPYGQDNSYGQNGLPQPAWQDPYAAQYGLGYAAPQQQASNGLAIGALIANIISAVLVCGIGLTWLPGIIVSAVALSRFKTDPESARKLTLWAWVCFTVNVVLTIVIIAIVATFD